ncbi:Kinesin-like protein kif9 [Clydaea vesicula]|uniref:Kinesin-like protein n=1 Tax=Clydaea vesicula TaxID=447962 RepID=A0AAD5UAK8_9FUNG|nr:Kinesin-like protein kif9 [Clydaea vesicula]
MSKSKHVKVVLRTRPSSNFAQDIINFGLDKKSTHIHIPKDTEGGYINNQQEDWDFKFDSILHNASQENVFEECAAPIVKGLFDGYNGTILAYGQTGAGKTFTMTGATENFKHRGLIPRTISQIYKDIADRPQTACSVRVSYLEIYNEQMIDLLSKNVSENNSQDQFQIESNLNVVEDKNGNSNVRGLTSEIANSEEEALNYLFEGETNRSISEHQLNKSSTRSHCIFTIYIEMRSRVESSEKVIYSKLNLVDLAGSERLSKTHTTGVSLKEAIEHIPYRQSKLTNVLRDALGGNCNTLLIANIWGEKEHIEETISTLRFATRMMCVSTTPQLNVQYDPLALIKKYEREIKELKQELSMHDTLTNRSHVHYEPLNEQQKMELNKTLRSYVDGEIEEIEIVNLRQIRECFNQFKNLVKLLEIEGEERLKFLGNKAANNNSMMTLPTGSRDATAIHSEKLQQFNEMKEVDQDIGVGDVEGSGFGIGLAPQKSNLKGKDKRRKGAQKGSNLQHSQLSRVLNSGHNDEDEETEKDVVESSTAIKDEQSGNVAANNMSSNNPNQLPPINGNQHITNDGLNAALSPSKKVSIPTTLPPPSRPEEFESFKKGKGSDMSKVLIENKNILRQKKKLAKEVAEELNSIKDELDTTKQNLDKKYAERNSGDFTDSKEHIVIDEEEYYLLNTLKTLRQQYRQKFEIIKQTRKEIEYCSRLVDQCRQRLMQEFEQYYENLYGQNLVEVVDENNQIGLQVEDVIDIGEKFDKIQSERMSHEDPDSLPYYNARKNTERKKQIQSKGRKANYSFKAN